MASKIFTVTIEDLPEKRMLGNWMSLNALEDKNEYTLVKEAFSRRLKGLPGFGTRAGYGVCSNILENLDCRYWTAVEDLPGNPAPNGMIPIILDAGRYACLSATKGVTLAEFYAYLCNSWERKQSAYLVDRQKSCFEFLGQQWARLEGLKFFVPLKERLRQLTLDEAPPARLSV